jgi:hypothetical protein
MLRWAGILRIPPERLGRRMKRSGTEEAPKGAGEEKKGPRGFLGPSGPSQGKQARCCSGRIESCH